MEGDRGPHSINVILRDAMPPQEVTSCIRSIHFESLAVTAVLRHQADIVEHGTDVEQFWIELEPPFLAASDAKQKTRLEWLNRKEDSVSLDKSDGVVDECTIRKRDAGYKLRFRD